MKRFAFFIVPAALLSASAVIVSCSNENDEPSADSDVVYQVSTMSSLKQGIFEGAVSYEDLEKHGDFGLGTFDGLDGEMVGLDGVFYQVKTDGIPRVVKGSMTTPFAFVTFFDTDRGEAVSDVGSIDELTGILDDLLPTRNIYYAIRVHGQFSHVKARSVPGQQEPYPPLKEVIDKQTIFKLNDVSGTIVGFYCPAYAKGISADGYHLHFITDDRKAGGHLLDCAIESGKVEIDDSGEFHIHNVHLESI